MTTPKRATGANASFRLVREPAYGQRPAGNWRAMSAFTFDLSEEQNLIDEPLLGEGREPTDPSRGAKRSAGNAVVPVDRRRFYDWLVGLLGDPAAPVQIGARGYIEFEANPAANDTITLDGIVWTFVAAAPAANETLIGADLGETLDTLFADLNASVDPALAAATYSRLGIRLDIRHDTADATGNAYTLAETLTPPGRLSAATLVGGGYFERVFQSGVASLPSYSTETEFGDLEAGSERFFTNSGIKVGSLTIERATEGAVRATVELVGQSEADHTTTQAGVPQDLAVQLFSQFNGQILIDDNPVGNVTGGSLTLRNNLDVVESLRNDGLIEGADEGIFGIEASLTSRFSNNALKTAVDAAQTVTLLYGFFNPAEGSEMSVLCHRLTLPKPRRPISGPGGIEVSYESRGSKDQTLGRSATVTLINDVADYLIP